MVDQIVCCEKEITFKDTGRKVTVPGLSGEKISSSEAAISIARGFLSDKPYEEVWAIALGGSGEVLGATRTSTGTTMSCTSYPRNVFAFVFALNACSFILAHNHIGSSPEPSPSDVRFTKDMAILAHKLGVSLLDHIIITPSASLSFSDNDYDYALSASGMGDTIEFCNPTKSAEEG